MRPGLLFLITISLVLASFGAYAAAGTAKPAERIHVTYWEKWTGFEKEGMESVVNDFNKSQDRIFVEYIAVSSVNQKALIAVAGGRPPDVAGLWDGDVVVFADKNALVPLDDYIRKAGIKPEDYIPAFWELCHYQGHVWALPSTPATTALHWNKGMFKAAGLDPERPPSTFAELDAFSRQITKIDRVAGRIHSMGFLPPEPGWWNMYWGFFFGGRLWDGGSKILIDDPGNIKAFEWIRSYAEQYGISALQTFRSTFGNFSSPEDAFLSGKVAMVLQGVWLNNYIRQYAPDMEWGACPFPVVKKGDDPFTAAQSDVLLIPRGSKHPDEAFEFIRYVNRQKPMEKLCLSHRKITPLSRISREFYQEHKNPYIRVFQDLARSKNAITPPKMSIWNEYSGEIYNAFDRVWMLKATPEQAIKEVKKRIQKSWDREQSILTKKPSKFLKVAPIIGVGAVLILLAFGMWIHGRLTMGKAAMAQAKNKSMLAKGLFFASPWLIGLTILVLYPVVASIIYSFCDYSVLSEPKWCGLRNYAELATDGVFWVSLKNTLIYAAFALPLGLVAALAVAILLDTRVKGMSFYRTMFFLPSLTPLVASAIIWLWIFNSQYGVLNYAISTATFGIIRPIPWLNDSRFAMSALIMMSLWGIGYTVVILLASLQDVPVSLYEAADMDGASWWQKIWHISLPMISPVIYFNIIMGIIGALQVFAVPYIMTSGGPARATLFYAMWLYDNAFRFLRMGYACAMAWILFIIILVLTLISVKISKTHVYYVGK